MSQTRTSFVLGGPSVSSSSSSSSANTVTPAGRAGLPMTAQASHSSIVDPYVLQQAWRAPTLLQSSVDALASRVLEVPRVSLDAIPVELIVLLMQSLSHNRLWSADILAHLQPFMENVDELSLAQCEFLRGDSLENVCRVLQSPLQSVDLSRSYHVVQYSGLLQAKLQECRTLDFDRCRRLTDQELLPILQATPLVEKVRLSGSAVKDPTVMALKDCLHLQELDLTSCIVSEGLTVLCPAVHLTDLRITGTNFPPLQLSAIRHLAPTLHTLHLQFVHRIKNETLVDIGACTRLTSLDLSRNSNLGDDGFIHLAGLTQLRTLNLSRTDLTEASTGVLKEMIHLTSFDCSYNAEVNDRMMLQLCRALVRLRVLILSCCGITDSTIVEGVALHQSHLQVLKLNGCIRVGDGALEVIAAMASQPHIPLVHPPHDEFNEASPLTSAMIERLESSAPRYSFPHGLLCLDIGSKGTTDACVKNLGDVLYGIDSLQRVGMWDSIINVASMKRSKQEWKDANNKIPSATHGRTPSDDNINCFPRPPSLGLSSIWLLDESMKTQPGTFLFIRRTNMADTSAISVIRPPTYGYQYGLDEFVGYVRTKRIGMKTVQFRDDKLEELIPDRIVTADESDSSTESEGEFNSVIRDDSDEENSDEEI